jgi:7-keto-8-aminopelargonate synthetase-like enzyme
MEASEVVTTIETLHREARSRGLFFQHAQDTRLEGRRVTVNGQRLLSFGSCSYLGLEFHPALVEGVCDAVNRFGTQFSCSRGYLSAPLYEELESTLDRLFEAHTLVAPTTTLAHLAAFDALMTEQDAIVLDHQVHQSVHQAANLARAKGTRVEVVRHEELDRARGVIADLARKHHTVWFGIDGVLSMYGDLAPFALLESLLAIAPNVRLYVDDAHGMSWKGKHGRGSFFAHMPLRDRILVATSMAKGFGVGGGILVFASAEERDRVRLCGGPLLFSGPIQPPMLGAALASARLHLTDEIVALQASLRDRVLHANRVFRAAGLPLLVENDVPIRFIRLGLPRVANVVAQAMGKDGFYVNVSMFPTVPMRRAGIRISINANHSLEDINRLTERLAHHIPRALQQEGISQQEVDALFAGAVVGRSSVAEASAPRAPPVAPYSSLGRGPRLGRDALQIEHATTIARLDRDEWNGLMRGRGTASFDSLAMLEKLFEGRTTPEHAWGFDYLIVRDHAGKAVAATHFTTALQKSDFLMRDEVSRAVELRRREDPYFLTSKVMMTGSTFSEGDHLYLDRKGPWRPALTKLLGAAHELYEASKAEEIVLRDLPAQDPELCAFLRDHGFVSVKVPDSHHLHIEWRDELDLAARLSKRSRKYVEEQMARASKFEVRTHGAGSRDPAALGPEEIAHLDALYRNVAKRKFRINVFGPPADFIPHLLASSAWELVTLRLDPAAGGPSHGLPVAFYAAHVHGDDYAVFLCGLDYGYVLDHGAYRQTLYQMVHQARLRGARHVHLGMDADTEKARYGTSVVESVMYGQARDHYKSSLLREIVAEVGVRVARAHPSGE